MAHMTLLTPLLFASTVHGIVFRGDDILETPTEGAPKVAKVWEQTVVPVFAASPGCSFPTETSSCWREFEVDGKRGFVPMDMLINDWDDIEYKRHTVAEKTFLYSAKDAAKGTHLMDLAEGRELRATDKRPSCTEVTPKSCWFQIEGDKKKGWIPTDRLHFPPKDAPWLYERFRRINYDNGILPVETFTEDEYKSVIAAADYDYRAQEMLRRTIYPFLKAKPADPRYAKFKKSLYARKLVRAIATAGVNKGSEATSPSRFLPESSWMDPYVFYLLIKSQTAWWDYAPKAAVAAHAKIVVQSAWLDGIPREYVQAIQVGHPELSMALIEARKPNDLTLELVPPADRDDRLLVLKAIEKSPQAFRLASDRLKSDPELLAKAVAGDPWLQREMQKTAPQDDTIRKQFANASIILGERGIYTPEERTWNDGDKVFVLEQTGYQWNLEERKAVVKESTEVCMGPIRTVTLAGDPEGQLDEATRLRSIAVISGPFKGGPVHPAFYDRNACLPRTKGATATCTFTLGGPEYRVTAKYTTDFHMDNSAEAGSVPGYDFTISDGTSSETLKNVPFVPFLGDLDRDGRLDIVTGTSGNSALYLSAPAKKGQLVKKVAEYSQVNC